jgi:hypothetical protein
MQRQSQSGERQWPREGEFQPEAAHLVSGMAAVFYRNRSGAGRISERNAQHRLV